MPAVADAGPLIHLAQIEKLWVLREFFELIWIVPEVKKEAIDEGLRLGHAEAKLLSSAHMEGWIVVEDLPDSLIATAKSMADLENVSMTDAKTLLLAREKELDILVDDRILSELAKMLELTVWNTWTILLEGVRRKLLGVSQVEAAVKELGVHRHKLREEQVKEILEAAARLAEK